VWGLVLPQFLAMVPPSLLLPTAPKVLLPLLFYLLNRVFVVYFSFSKSVVVDGRDGTVEATISSNSTGYIDNDCIHLYLSLFLLYFSLDVIKLSEIN
jgi:hypothetical protein